MRPHTQLPPGGHVAGVLTWGPKQVQTLLGHASAVITLRTYAHPWPGDDDLTRDVLDTALSPLADSLRTEAASR